MSAAIPGNTVAFGYDAQDRATSETGALGAVGYEYDAAGNMTRVTWPDGYYAADAFNDASEMTTVKENGAAVLAAGRSARWHRDRSPFLSA